MWGSIADGSTEGLSAGHGLCFKSHVKCLFEIQGKELNTRDEILGSIYVRPRWGRRRRGSPPEEPKALSLEGAKRPICYMLFFLNVFVIN